MDLTSQCKCMCRMRLSYSQKQALDLLVTLSRLKKASKIAREPGGLRASVEPILKKSRSSKAQIGEHPQIACTRHHAGIRSRSAARS